MIIFDANGNVLEDPDLDVGYVEPETLDVTHTWVVDTPEEGHYEVIAEYPNGGKDIEWQIDTPEEGHWETRDQNGAIVEHFDGFIPDDLPKEEQHSDIWQFLRYTPYPEDELAQMQKNSQIAEKKAELAQTDYVVIKMAESMVSSTTIDESDYDRYEKIILRRQQLRSEINALEEVM